MTFEEVLNKKLYSKIEILLIFGLVSCFCFMFYYVKQPNWAADVIRPTSIILQSNSSGSPTTTKHIVFGLVGSQKGMLHRKNYLETWWRANEFRGFLYLDKPPQGNLLPWSPAWPPYRVSDDLTELVNETRAAEPSMIRIAHAIMEVVRDAREGFRWLVMGDDDSIFFVDNMVDVLAKFDHTKYYYIGTTSENLVSNQWFSFKMGYGGGGFILSYPLAKALANDMEGCLRSYAHLLSGDHIAMACIADIGVDLTPHQGLHQVDVRNNIEGFLSALPKNLLMSLHHFDAAHPIFPFTKNRFIAINHLMEAAKIDQSRLLQKTNCHLRERNWSISISWGYSVYIYEKIWPRSWLQLPIETFGRWAGPKTYPPRYYTFDTRRPSRDPCEDPHYFFFDSVEKMHSSILTRYNRFFPRGLPPCGDSQHSGDNVSHIDVYSPPAKRVEIDRSECCDITYEDETKIATVKLRECKPEEIIR